MSGGNSTEARKARAAAKNAEGLARAIERQRQREESRAAPTSSAWARNGGHRPGAGRRPEGPGALTARREFRVSEATHEAISLAAEAAGQEDAEWLREAIDEKLQRAR